jgi:hypothetical protein
MIPGSSASRAYWREIALVLLGKSIALAVIYLLFFSSPPPVTNGSDLFQQGSLK